MKPSILECVCMSCIMLICILNLMFCSAVYGTKSVQGVLYCVEYEVDLFQALMLLGIVACQLLLSLCRYVLQ